MKGFASDNFAGAHPEILEAIHAANDDHAVAYGFDPWTERAEEGFRQHFGPEARGFAVFNGTAANVLSLAATCESWQAAICAAGAHLNVDECGAPERLVGVKLIPVPTEHGKLVPDAVEAAIRRVGDQHAVQPRVVTISQATEVGTIYTTEEVAALADLAHSRDMLLHVDGARLANAAARLGTSLGALTTEAGVDVLSFGGTKNGLLLGEAVVFLRPELAERFEFVRKQFGQLASKMRFISVQLAALLEGDLWLRNATHANQMAQRLGTAAESLEGIELAHPVESNAVFPRLPASKIPRIQEAVAAQFPFYIWDQSAGIARWMCAWDTRPEDVERFVSLLTESLRP